MNTDKSEYSLTNDVPQNVLALKGRSAHYFTEAVAEVQKELARGGLIYPPSEFPREGSRFPVSDFRNSPDSDLDGSLLPAEAVAYRLLFIESSALLQASSKGENLWIKIIGGSQEVDAIEILEGISDFGGIISSVAKIREKLLCKEGRSKGNKLKDTTLNNLFDTFDKPLKQDGLTIGENTANAIEETVGALFERNIHFIPDKKVTEAEVQARIKGRKRGAMLAKNLYLETLNLASTYFMPNIRNF